MNRILEDVLENRKGHYCHALEAGDVEELKMLVESFIDNEGDKYSTDDYVEFFESMEFYVEDDTDLDGFLVGDFIVEYLF